MSMGYGALTPNQQSEAALLAQHAAGLGLPQQPQGTQVKISLPDTGSAPVPIEDAEPGSIIAVWGPGFYPGEKCTVLQRELEWGPNSIPALHLVDDNGQRRLLTSGMQGARIQILVSAAQLGIEQIPEGAVRARTRPLDVVALQWKGGAAEAAKVILWATRFAVLRFHEEEAAGDEYMVVEKLDRSAEEFLRPGDYLVKDPDGKLTVVENAEFARLYEEVALFG